MSNKNKKGPTSSPVADARNPGTEFDPEWIREISVDSSALEAKARSAAEWPGPPEADLSASLLQVVRCLDLTTLSGNDTTARVRRLCRSAVAPLPRSLKRRLDMEEAGSRVAAVCVFPAFLNTAKAEVEGSPVRTAAVAAGFPHGLSPLGQRVSEVAEVAAMGADEIDVVVRREWALSGKWDRLYEEVREFKEAAGTAHLKVILSTGDLTTANQIVRSGLTALQAGADFIKTSTGKEAVNATPEAGLAMAVALRAFQDRTGFQAGLKAAGGIRRAIEGLRWLRLVEEELGPEAARPHRFRIGASGLLADLILNLEAALGV